MGKFNASEWALSHRSFVWFLMAICLVAGTLAYRGLGREEDPPFAIKTMVVQAVWPGATIGDTLEQVTDRIEKELQQIATLDYVRSYTTPGNATVFVNLRDTTKASEIQPSFYQVRKRLGDIQGTFPQGMQGPFFNDEFGDVYGNVYGFTADGLSHRQLRDYVEGVRTEILKVPNIGKTLLLGTQKETIFLDFSTRKLAGYGIDIQSLIKTLQSQNAISPSGVVQAGRGAGVSVRVGGAVRRPRRALKAINLRVNDRFFRLSDVADIHPRLSRIRRQPLFRVQWPSRRSALPSRCAPGGNLLHFGDDLKGQACA